MDLFLLSPGEPPAADAIATWTCPDITVQLRAGGGRWTVRAVEEFHHVPVGALQLTLFAGPRSAAQQRADDLADRRIRPAVAEVRGLAGAVLAEAEDGARAVLVLADRTESLHAGMERLFGTELLPEEDPAMVPRPESNDLHVVTHASHALRDLPAITHA